MYLAYITRGERSCTIGTCLTCAADGVTSGEPPVIGLDTFDREQGSPLGRHRNSPLDICAMRVVHIPKEENNWLISAMLTS